MIIRIAKDSEVRELTQVSKEAFDTDIHVGGTEIGGPPEYDNENWHQQMAKEEHLYSVIEDNQVIGGALLFQDENERGTMYLGRIFIDPKLHHKGYGIQMMQQLEEMFPQIDCWKLDTPIWNRRTNQFYRKLGYHETSRDNGFVYYEKVK